MKQKILVKDLKPGMFIYELDRPWVDTPYLFQGFTIWKPEEIEELAHYCEYVYIDPIKGQYEIQPTERGAKGSRLAGKSESSVLLFRGPNTYQDTRPMEAELDTAKEVQQTAAEIAEGIAISMQTSLSLDLNSARGAVDGLRESIVRNPDALMLLSRVREVKSSEFQRAIDVTVYLLAFARELGMSKEDMSVLGLGGLLLDVGKLKLPSELLDKAAAYTAAEYMVLKRHVAYGEMLLCNVPGIPEGAMQMVMQHHEREDGGGYPRGLRTDQISTFGRMAGIVDCYTDLVSPKTQGFPMSPQEALQMIHSWTGRHFHPALVDVFIGSMGIFPPGSLVELNTGEVGIVLSRGRGGRLQPRLLLVLDPKKNRYPTPKPLDLSARPFNGYGIQYEIGRGLEFGMYGIHPKDYL